MPTASPDNTKPVRVLLVDDDARIRESLPVVFDCTRRFQIVATLPSADGLIYHIVKHRPDIVLLDLDMPGRSPFDTLAELFYRGDQARVLMLSAISDVPSIRSCLEAGAFGYILKDDGLEAIEAGMRTVMEGGRYLSPSLLRLDLGELIEEPAAPWRWPTR